MNVTVDRVWADFCKLRETTPFGFVVDQFGRARIYRERVACNQAEIAALAGLPATARGVDATGPSEQTAVATRALSKTLPEAKSQSQGTTLLSNTDFSKLENWKGAGTEPPVDFTTSA